ncbi:diacylglycerol kinase family protein [Candidatus Atribacteria bacterium MT.SAG.1]|nr:diacylglycerol kinase family protein [Candidatus Atribacteria bacterium MT.SAG.1]
MINFKKLNTSIKTAIIGLRSVIKEEQTFKIQTAVAILVVFFMFYFPLSALERTILILSIVLVLGLELINSQIERVLDFLEPEFNHKIRMIKDLSASAVLVVVIGSIFIGLLIFLPYVL